VDDVGIIFVLLAMRHLARSAFDQIHRRGAHQLEKLERNRSQ
jgi:hypothetical protein